MRKGISPEDANPKWAPTLLDCAVWTLNLRPPRVLIGEARPRHACGTIREHVRVAGFTEVSFQSKGRILVFVWFPNSTQLQRPFSHRDVVLYSRHERTHPIAWSCAAIQPPASSSPAHRCRFVLTVWANKLKNVQALTYVKVSSAR